MGVYVIEHKIEMYPFFKSFIFSIPPFLSISPSFFSRFLGLNNQGSNYCPLKVRLEEHRKAEERGEIEKSSMADHI